MASKLNPKQAQCFGQEEGKVNGWEGVHRARYSDVCAGGAWNISKGELNWLELLTQEPAFLGHVDLE